MSRAARLVLAATMVLTTAIALRYHDGHDFINNVWAPTRGLLAGLDPYDPGNVEYFTRYPVPVVAGLYLPAALALHAPLTLLSAERGADIMAALNAGLIWLGVLLLIPPRSNRACLVAAGAGALVLLGAAAQDTIYLGQLSGWAFAGLALLARSLGDDPSAVWFPALGAALVALKPQSAIPMLVALGVLGHGRVLARAAAILALASVPGVVLFIRAAGSLPAMLRTAADNLSSFPRLPPVDLSNPTNLRIDALGMVSQLHGPALSGLGWLMLSLGVATGLFMIALPADRDGGPRNLADPWVVTLVTVYITVALYHLMYDQLLLYVGPLAAFALLARDPAGSRRARVVAGGGLMLLAAGVVFRSGMRERLVAYGLPALSVHRAWVAIPTLLGLAMVCTGLLSERLSHTAR
jgi:hypothetical protein